jgi:hypothetical protein
MKLSPEDAREYFQLMWGLLLFVNQEIGHLPNIQTIEAYAKLDVEGKMPIREHLFEHPELIDRYVQKNPHQLDRAALEVLLSWKNFVKGSFFIERLLKKHAIFIKDNEVYAVLGLIDSFDEIIDPRRLPLYVAAILLPYKGQIIYDGVLQAHSIYFGGNIKRELKEQYLAAKQQQRIITTLEPNAARTSASDPILLPDLTPEIEELQKLAKKLRAAKGTPAIWSPTFSLVRAALDMAHVAVQQPDRTDQLWEASAKIEQALQRVQTVLYRSEM